MEFRVAQLYTFEELVKKSRFIGVIASCESEQDVLHKLKALQVQHPHANHIAFAYRLKIDSNIILIALQFLGHIFNRSQKVCHEN